jgi:hypothetical protein
VNDFESFLRWEAQSRDTIDFKKAYVDIAGDVVAGLMLSQIIYWYLPSHGGDEKLRVERDGKKWLVKTRDDWWAECRLSPREADRARKNLEGLGILEVKVYKFNGSPTQHLRILKDRFLELWQKVVDGGTSRAKRKSSRGGGEGQGGADMPEADQSRHKSLKSPISPNGEMDFTERGDGFYRNREMDLTNRGEPRTEITTKSTTETAASDQVGVGTTAAADSLIKELVSHGVSRAAAVHLAKTKPDACRRCLDYLPFAQIRKTKGAWLANAIRDEYGPPEGYLKAEQERKRRTASRSMARQTAQKAPSRQKLEWLSSAYEQMAKSNGDALAAFSAYVEEERRRVAHIARGLTEKRRDRLVAAFDEPGRRLELFEQWLASGQGRVFRHDDTSQTVEIP